MLAARVHDYITSFEEIKMDHIPIPTIRPGHVLIKNYYSSANPADPFIVKGYFKNFGWHCPFPLTIGEDYAGVIVEVADDVKTEFAVGDEVFGFNWGYTNIPFPDPVVSSAFAEYVLVHASIVSKKPKEISFQDAAAVGLVGLTAYEILMDVIQIKSTDKVLILGASSAVGQCAVQIAKNVVGAYVVTTASSRTFDFVSSKLGADRVINYNETKWYEDPDMKDLDVIFDVIGEKQALENAVANKVIKSDGKFVSAANHEVGFNPLGHPPLKLACFHGCNVSSRVQDECAKLMVEGKLKVFIDEVFPFTQEGVIKIMEKVATKKSVGKNMLQINPSAK